MGRHQSVGAEALLASFPYQPETVRIVGEPTIRKLIDLFIALCANGAQMAANWCMGNEIGSSSRSTSSALSMQELNVDFGESSQRQAKTDAECRRDVLRRVHRWEAQISRLVAETERKWRPLLGSSSGLGMREQQIIERSLQRKAKFAEQCLASLKQISHYMEEVHRTLDETERNLRGYGSAEAENDS